MPTKKEIKQAIHEHGFFLSFPIQTNAVDLKKKYKSEIERIPSDAFAWGGIASQEVINMNGYGIRLKAWKPAISDYLTNNPIIFYGHDDKAALGQTLAASVTKDSLEVMGYVRRQADQHYAAGNIEAGIYRMLSTGHVTKDFEFQNSTTSEVIDKAAFYEKVNNEGYGEWLNEWFMWVTQLAFLEWSIVGVGAVPGAFKSNTAEDIWLNHFNISKEDITMKILTNGTDLPATEAETPTAAEEPTTAPAENADEVTAEPVEAEPVQTVEDTEPEAENADGADVEGEPEAEPAQGEPVTNAVASTAAAEFELNEVRRIALLSGQKAMELEARLNRIESRINGSSAKKVIQTKHDVNLAQGGRTLADLLKQ